MSQTEREMDAAAIDWARSGETLTVKATVWVSAMQRRIYELEAELKARPATPPLELPGPSSPMWKQVLREFRGPFRYHNGHVFDGNEDLKATPAYFGKPVLRLQGLRLLADESAPETQLQHEFGRMVATALTLLWEAEREQPTDAVPVNVEAFVKEIVELVEPGQDFKLLESEWDELRDVLGRLSRLSRGAGFAWAVDFMRGRGLNR